MPVSSVERPVSALRQRMLEDMAMRGLRSDTQHDYVRTVRSFAAFLGQPPDTATAEDIRRFQVHQRESGVQPPTEMCRVVDTVLIDQETIYAPRHGNDRLLLGLKGSLNEYELDLLRQRSLSARYEKARRGELVVSALQPTAPFGSMTLPIRPTGW
jgi:hypothetical protein